MKNKKFYLTENYIEKYGRILYQIRALQDFGYMKAGELGGFIESETNLSHRGNCWVAFGAIIYGNANVSDNARIDGGIHLSDNAQIYGNAHICGAGKIWENVKIFGNACIMNIFGYFKIAGNAEVSGGYITDSVSVVGNAKVRNGQIYGSAKIFASAVIDGDVIVQGSAMIGNNAYLTRKTDLFWCGLVGFSNTEVNFYNTLNDGIWVNFVNEFNEQKPMQDCNISDFLIFAKQHYAEKEYREFELLTELVKSRILGDK